MHTQLFGCVWLFPTQWTVAHQAPLSMGFPRKEYWSGLTFPLQIIFYTIYIHAYVYYILRIQIKEKDLLLKKNQSWFTLPHPTFPFPKDKVISKNCFLFCYLFMLFCYDLFILLLFVKSLPYLQAGTFYQMSGGIQLEIKCTINVMCLNHPKAILSLLICGKTVFHETSS